HLHLLAEVAPALVTVHDDHALDLIAAEFALDLRAIMVEALDGRPDVDRVVIAIDGKGAFRLPRGTLGLLELLLAAQGLDRLVQDRFGVLVLGPDRAVSGDEEDCQRRTEEPLHGIASQERRNRPPRSVRESGRVAEIVRSPNRLSYFRSGRWQVASARRSPATRPCSGRPADHDGSGRARLEPR